MTLTFMPGTSMYFVMPCFRRNPSASSSAKTLDSVPVFTSGPLWRSSVRVSPCPCGSLKKSFASSLATRRDVREVALDLVRLALHADQPHRAAAEDRLVDAGHVLAVDPDEVADAGALPDERRSPRPSPASPCPRG
jgi:hypothetical protein